jgi:hypothetical protein
MRLAINQQGLAGGFLLMPTDNTKILAVDRVLAKL